MAKLDVMYTSNKDDWGTPQGFFEHCNYRWKFTVDGAANEHNHKLLRWFGPGSDIAEDALLAPRFEKERIWLNPPYSKIKEFVWWADFRMQLGDFIVLLIPSRTDTKYWHNHIWDHLADTKQPGFYGNWRPGVTGCFIKGRLKFTQPGMVKQNSAPFPSALILFGEP